MQTVSFFFYLKFLNFKKKGTLKSDEELLKIAEGFGVKEGGRCVAMCGSGTTAAAIIFAFHVCGLDENAKLICTMDLGLNMLSNPEDQENRKTELILKSNLIFLLFFFCFRFFFIKPSTLNFIFIF